MTNAEPTLGQMAEALRRCPTVLPRSLAGYALRAGLVAFLPGYRPDGDWRRQAVRWKRRWWQVIPLTKHTVVFWVANGVLRRVCVDGRVVHRAAARIPPEGDPS